MKKLVYLPNKQIKIYIDKTFASPIFKNLLRDTFTISHNTASIYQLKFNNRNTRTMCEISLKLTKKTPERRHWRRSIVFIVNFEHISHIVLMFLLLVLSRWMPAGIPDNIYLLKINNGNIRKRSEICSKLTKSHQNNVTVVFLLLTLNIFQIFQTFF